MNILLDTHIAIWFIDDSDKIKHIKTDITNRNNNIYYSSEKEGNL